VCSELVKSKNRELMPLVMEIHDKVPSAVNIDYYFKELTQLSFKRKMKSELVKAANRINDVSENAQDIFSDLLHGLDEASFSIGSEEYSTIKKYVVGAIGQMEKEHAMGGILPGITPRLECLRDNIGSLVGGEYVVIGARPSVGKTALLANNIIKDAIIYDKKKVGMFTLEMTGNDLARRLIQSQSGVDTSPMGVCGNLTTRFFDKIMVAASDLVEDERLIIDDCRFGLTLSRLQAKARRMVRNDGCELIGIDYLGLMDSDEPKLMRHEQISKISRGIQRLAIELDVPFIVLSQLTRIAEGERPNISNLRDSGSVEQDADRIILLHRDREESDTEIINAKARKGNGKCFTVKASFNSERIRFEDVGR
jgi:replicative DNA helicase